MVTENDTDTSITERVVRMGVRFTDSEAVAMYDSVTGQAFGPVFADEDEAEDFLTWLGTKEMMDETFPLGDDKIWFTADTRKYTLVELMEAYLLWQKDTGRYEEPSSD